MALPPSDIRSILADGSNVDEQSSTFYVHRDHPIHQTIVDLRTRSYDWSQISLAINSKYCHKLDGTSTARSRAMADACRSRFKKLGRAIAKDRGWTYDAAFESEDNAPGYSDEPERLQELEELCKLPDREIVMLEVIAFFKDRFWTGVCVLINMSLTAAQQKDEKQYRAIYHKIRACGFDEDQTDEDLQGLPQIPERKLLRVVRTMKRGFWGAIVKMAEIKIVDKGKAIDEYAKIYYELD